MLVSRVLNAEHRVTAVQQRDYARAGEAIPLQRGSRQACEPAHLAAVGQLLEGDEIHTSGMVLPHPDSAVDSVGPSTG
jgi:hypothetical protein